MSVIVELVYLRFELGPLRLPPGLSPLETLVGSIPLRVSADQELGYLRWAESVFGPSLGSRVTDPAPEWTLDMASWPVSPARKVSAAAYAVDEVAHTPPTVAACFRVRGVDPRLIQVWAEPEGPDSALLGPLGPVTLDGPDAAPFPLDRHHGILALLRMDKHTMRRVTARTVTWRWRWGPVRTLPRPLRRSPFTRAGTVAVTSHRIYVLARRPAAPWNPEAGSASSPWTTALEQACPMAEDAATERGVARRLTRALQDPTRPGMRYDGVTGASSLAEFGDDWSVVLGLSGWLAALQASGAYAETPVNCMDCAALLCALCGLLGAPMTQVYVGSFGYLRRVQPVGCGPTNNPLYLGDGWASEPLIPAEEQTLLRNEIHHMQGAGTAAEVDLGVRSYFQNHHVAARGSDTARRFYDATMRRSAGKGGALSPAALGTILRTTFRSGLRLRPVVPMPDILTRNTDALGEALDRLQGWLVAHTFDAYRTRTCDLPGSCEEAAELSPLDDHKCRRGQGTARDTEGIKLA